MPAGVMADGGPSGTAAGCQSGRDRRVGVGARPGARGRRGVACTRLAREVGMRQPSLYAYFDSKLALYDAMFADGNRQLLERLDAVQLPRNPRTALKKFMAALVALRRRGSGTVRAALRAPHSGLRALAGVLRPRRGRAGTRVQADQRGRRHRAGDIDCIVAMVAGLMEAQTSNDPGGNRWTRHLNRLIDLYVDDAIKRSRPPMMPNRIPSVPRPASLAEEEFRRFADLVASLTPEEWAAPTDCTGWDVRKIALHVLGSGDAQASVREFAHQLRRGMPLNKEIDVAPLGRRPERAADPRARPTVQRGDRGPE